MTIIVVNVLMDALHLLLYFCALLSVARTLLGHKKT